MKIFYFLNYVKSLFKAVELYLVYGMNVDLIVSFPKKEFFNFFSSNDALKNDGFDLCLRSLLLLINIYFIKIYYLCLSQLQKLYKII